MRAFCRQLVHGVDKHFGAMDVVTEHVEARTRGRQQHRIAWMRQALRLFDGFLQTRGAMGRDPAARDGGRDQVRVAPDQHHRAGVGLDAASGAEVLPLAVAAEITTTFLALPRCPPNPGPLRWRRRWCPWNRRTSSRPRSRRPFPPGAASPRNAQPAQQCFHRQAQRTGQRQRRQGVGGVMQPGHRQRMTGEIACRRAERSVHPRTGRSPLVRAAVEAEPRPHARPGSAHRQPRGIVAVQHLHAAAAKIRALAAA